MTNQKKNWVDYKEIKARVTMEMVLERYGLLEGLKSKGASLIGSCPIHQGHNSRQFVVNTEKNVFNCFGNCKSGGNVIDFVARMEKIDLRQAGLLLKNWFLSEAGKDVKPEAKNSSTGQIRPKKKDTQLVREEKEAGLVNPPLSFELKSLKTDHEFFAEQGIRQDTINYFGLGFCQKGLMVGRIAIPIHNEKGELVAYCGRAIEKDPEEKYKLPLAFVKSRVAYNLNRQKPGIDTLILVESFLSVFRLYQAGFKEGVALMGSILSEDQEKLITEFLGPAGRVLLLFDDDESGEHCTNDCLARLSPHLFVKALNIGPLAKKPHKAKEEDLITLLKPYF